MSRSWFLVGVAAALTLTTACDPTSTTSNAGGSGGSGASSQGGNGANTSQGGAGPGGFGGSGPGGFGGSGPSNGGSTGNPCESGADEDKDEDGFSVNDGDCNDCDKNVNPGAIEVIAEPDMNGMTPPAADEDCDGMTDNVPTACDTNLALDDTDAFNAAKAIELCQQASASDKKWGVLTAKYVRADGTSVVAPNALQHGLTNKFGQNINVQGGQNMLVLSAGNARDADDPNPCNFQSCATSGAGVAPPGFPQQVCNASPFIYDDIALDLRVRSPKNATGYSFNFRFTSFEYSEWVCTSYNDQFIALVNPAPPGSINGNISFDSMNNPVSVNIGFFDVCPPETCDPNTFAMFCNSGCPSPPSPCCPAGPADLVGTGFDVWGDAGGTSWLKTQAPIKGGDEVTIRFTIWDAGDQNLDSTVLIDNFKWIANGGTVAIGTEEVPEPK